MNLKAMIEEVQPTVQMPQYSPVAELAALVVQPIKRQRLLLKKMWRMMMAMELERAVAVDVVAVLVARPIKRLKVRV
jgi:hypothetical protein